MIWDYFVVKFIMETFNITIVGVGNITVSADSLDEAIEIVQAYIDKRSLD